MRASNRFRFRKSPVGILALGVALAACSDSPSSPRLNAAAELVAPDATAQTALAGQAVLIAPTVIVRDSRGQPMAGTTVTFTVTQGGGTIEHATAVTALNGAASAGRWTLGTVAGTNEVIARVGLLPPVRFTATGTAPPPAVPLSDFDITVRFLSPPTTRQQMAVELAVKRWRAAIVSDLPDIPVTAAAGACLANQPAINEIVDDLLLLVEFVEIDGAGKTLGEAGPCYIRSTSGLPVVGHMRLDATDLVKMEVSETLDDVVMHEMGHILGIGTIWTNKELLTGAGTVDPLFTGVKALAEYRLLGGLDNAVPVENTGGTGTRDGHWRESVFTNELMTGWVGSTPNPLSAMTIASLQDLGYGASLVTANTYVLGGGTQGVTTSVDLRESETLVRPKYRIDRFGRKEYIGG